MIRERIFSSVLLPAPLRPIRPTTSPWAIVIDRSRTAPDYVVPGLRRAAAKRPARRLSEALAQGPVAYARRGQADVALADVVQSMAVSAFGSG